MFGPVQQSDDFLNRPDVIADASLQLEYRALRGARHAAGRTDAVTFHEGGYYLRSLGGTQLVHGPSMLERLSMVKPNLRP